MTFCRSVEQSPHLFPCAHGQTLREILAASENSLPAISPVHDVIDRSRILHSQLTRHSSHLADPSPARQGQMSYSYALTRLRFAPFEGLLVFVLSNRTSCLSSRLT